MKTLFLLGLLTFPFSSESNERGIFNNDYELSNSYDPTFSPGPYDSFREELVVDQFIEESSDFKIKARNVKQWLRMRMDCLYFLGIGDKEVSLISMYEDKRQPNHYRAHEYPVAVQYQVSCGVMFQTPNPWDNSSEGVVLLALKSPRPIISVYKIKHFKLHHIVDWPQEYDAYAIKHFKWQGENRFMVFEDLKYTSRATVYGFEFNNRTPHIWFIEMISLGSTKGYPTLGMAGEHSLFLATIKSDINAVNIYSYKTICDKNSGSKFDLMLTIQDLIASKIEFFQGYGHLYFVASGSPSVLFRITPDGYLMKDIIFGSAVEMLPVPVETNHHDTILLGKSRNGIPHVYTFVGNGLWEEKLVLGMGPKCRRSSDVGSQLVDLKECIGGTRSWDGATFIETDGDQYPAILFADKHNSSQLYYLPFSFVKIPTVHHSITPIVLERLESYWNNLRTSLRKLIVGRTPEEKSQITSSYCSIEKEVNEMHNFLSSIKMPLEWANCSSPLPSHGPKEDERVIADEAKPIETISLPDTREPNRKFEAPEENKEEDQHLPAYHQPMTDPSFEQHNKAIPISPDMNSWNNKDIFNDQNDGHVIT